MSILTAYSEIQERSEATPGLFNRILSTLSANIRTASEGPFTSTSTDTLSFTTNLSVSGGAHFQHISIGSTPPSEVTTAAVIIGVNSAFSDYLYLTDSSGARSNYVIGSRAGGTADGLNIWDASGDTMIASFSKQSVRFWQNVVGPVFDIGGALASTYNAATFGTGAQSIESRIQAAISQATIDGVSRVYVPASMYPYSAGSVSFDTRVQMVREGGDWSVHDVFAYGAAGNGIRDDTNAIQSAFSNAIIASAITFPGVRVFFPAGSYSITTTLTITNRESFVLYGVGNKGSRLEWSGASGLPMLRLTNCGRGLIDGLGFWGDINANPSAGIQCHVMPGHTITSVRFMAFNNLQLGSSVNTNIQRGIQFTAQGGFDQSNDDATISNCEFTNCTIAGVSLEHDQTKGHVITQCKMTSCVRAVATDQGAGALGGSFTCSDSQLNACSVAVFTLGAPNDPILLSGLNTEISRRFLETGGPSSNAWPITIIGCRYSSESLAADGRAIVYKHVGPLTMIGNQFPSNLDSGNTSPVIYIDGISLSTRLERLVSIGNRFNTPSPYSFVHPATSGLFSVGNQYHDGTDYRTLPDSFVPVLYAAPGTALLPSLAISSESSLGLYRSGSSSLGMSYGQFQVASGTALQPGLAFSSESSLGFYRSAASTWALSYGTLQAPTSTFSRVATSPTVATAVETTGLRLGVAPAGSSDPIEWVLATSGSGYGFRARGVDNFNGTADWELAGRLNSASWTVGLLFKAFTQQLALPTGTALAPSSTFTSDLSLGWFRSAASVMALSYGTLTADVLQASGRTLQISTAAATGDAGTAAGVAGQIKWAVGSGATWLYLCTSANSWMRVALSPF